jgi:uncharacterized SAM-binding protein YcdF (DUF218 family)
VYAFKQFVGALTHPGTVAFALVLAGLALRRFGRTRPGTALLICGALFAWLASTPLIGRWLLAPLESQYPPLREIPTDVHYVVVLGSSYMPGRGLPVTAAIDDAGLKRLVEGVRLHRLIPGSRLVVSGGAAPGAEAPAVGNFLLAQALGVPSNSIVQLLDPLDTRGEAAAVSNLTRSARFLLVTSASHMPRAVAYMRLAGGQPVAAPTGHRIVATGFHPMALIPSAGGLRMTEDAFHEYLGWLALKADVH